MAHLWYSDVLYPQEVILSTFYYKKKLENKYKTSKSLTHIQLFHPTNYLFRYYRPGTWDLLRINFEKDSSDALRKQSLMDRQICNDNKSIMKRNK